MFRPENINTLTGIKIDEQSNERDSYSAANRLFAGYLSLNLPLTKKLNLIAGARLEGNQQLLNSADAGVPIRINNPITRLLPSANLSYNFTEKMLVRAAYGQTLNRPEFRELAPFSFYDFDYNYTNKGFPFLQTPKIQNVDVRWELYPTPAEVLSVALFYKEFENPIETYFVPGAGSQGAKTFTYGNAPEAISQGIELEAKKSLSTLTTSSFLQDLSVLVNLSLIRSEVNTGIVVNGSDKRPLQGQSNYIVNSGLYYNNVKSGWQVNLLYNVVGKRIFIVGYEGYPDIYDMPRSVLDLTFGKSFGNHWQIEGGIIDIFNQESLLLQNGNLDDKFDRKVDQAIQRYKPGTVFTLGFTYTFRKND